MKYLIALDLDGTLLNDDKNITKETNEYLTKLISEGHKVVISTGRPYAGMGRYYEELKLDTPIVNSNGALVHSPNDKNFITRHVGIDKDIIIDICSKMEYCIVEGFFGFENKMYYTNSFKYLSPFIHFNEDSIVKQGRLHEICDCNAGSLILLIKAEAHKEFEEYVKSSYDGIEIRFFYNDDKYYLYEVYLKCISKASGLQYVLDYYNMDKKQLIAFGDGTNDIEMLEYAYVSVAMINSNPKVLECAKYITKLDNNNNGVIHFLDHYLGYNTME